MKNISIRNLPENLRQLKELAINQTKPIKPSAPNQNRTINNKKPPHQNKPESIPIPPAKPAFKHSNTLDIKNLMSSLFEDNDKILIILLIILLMDNEENFFILLVLLYLLA